jgi:hypothetical protein
MSRNGWYTCQLSEVREIMRPVPLQLPGGAGGLGLCDGIHQSAHEFIPA